MHAAGGSARAGFWAATIVALLLLPAVTAVGGPAAPAGPEGPAGPREGAGRAITGLAWPMFGHDAHHTSDAGPFARNLTEPMLRWSTASSIESRGTAVGNFTGNIILNQTASYDRRTLHAVFAENGLVEIVEASTGATMWQAPLGGTLLAAPALADFDQNGRLELVLVSSTGNVSCYEPVTEWNGSAYNWSGRSLSSQRRWDAQLGAEAGYTSPVLGDVSGDGVSDVVLCAGRTLFVLHGQNGTVAWNATLPGNIATSPALVRYGTGGLWVAAQSFNTTIVLLERTYFTLFNDKGQESWTKSVALSSGLTTVVALPSPAAADLNKDGFQETIFISPFESGTGRLYVYKQDGSTLWSPFQLKGQCEGPPAVGDLDADSTAEIAVACWNYTLPTNGRILVTSVDAKNGTEEWTKTIDRSFDLFTERAATGPALADLDSDKASDLVVAGFNGRVFGLKGRSGADLWEYNSTRVSLLSPPSVADAETDGFPEVFVDGLALAQRIAELSVAAGDISFSNETPAENDAVTVTAFVKNTGTKGVSGVTVRFSDIYDNDTVWTADRAVNVSAGGSAGATVTWTAAGGGRHAMHVEVDPQNAVEEITEDNNRASKEISVFSHYTLSASCAQNESYINGGDEAVYLVNVKNEGDTSQYVTVNLSGTPAGWTASTSTGRLQLDGGKSSTVTVRARAPAGATAGPYPLKATARSEAAPANRATVTLTTHVRGQHGVSMTPRTVSQNCMADDLATYLFNVTNTGNSDDTFVFSNTSPPQDWLVFLNQQSVDLPAGRSMDLTVIVRPPPPAGEGARAAVDITATCSADPGASAVSSTLTTVVLPDLVVKGIRFFRRDGAEADGARIHLVDGKNATISTTIRNIRDNVDIQLVKTDILDGDVAIGSEYIGPLPAGEDGRLDIPWRPSEGLHDVTAITDSLNRVRESNEDNNRLSVAAQVKGRTASGPYVVSGTVTRQGGAAAGGAAVAVTNLRTGQALSLAADASGKYTADIAGMPGGYEEEEALTVAASDGLTTCSTTILAYSEDGGKQVDLALLPGAHDLHLTAVTQNVNTDPASPAVYKLWVTNLGSEMNTVLVNHSALPSGWTGILENSSGVRTSLLSLPPAGTANATDFMLFKLTPPADARAGARTAVRVQASSVNDSTVKRYVDTTTTVNQLYSSEVSGVKGQTIQAGAAARFNFTVKNTGNGNDSFDLTVGAPPGLSAVLDRALVTLGGFASAAVPVDITAAQDIAPGTYNITLEARSRYSPVGATGRGELALTVESFRYEVRLTGGLGALGQEDGASVNFTIRNNGNADDVFTLLCRPDTPAVLPSDWSYGLRRNGSKIGSIGLAPGEHAVLSVLVEPPREISGVSTVAFNVTAYSEMDLNVSASTMVSLSIERPDLLFLGSGLRMSPASPKAGERVRLTATVLNQGYWGSPRTALSFFVDGRSAGDVTVPPIPMAAQTEVSWNWTATEGTHTFKAVLNPEGSGQVRELTYQNNDVTQNVLVGSASPVVAWWLVGGFAAVFVAVLVVYFALTRKPAGRRRRRPARDEEDEDYEGDEENEEDEAEEEGEGEEGGEEEDAGGEEAEDAGEEPGEDESEEGGAGGEDGAETVEVEAIEVVAEDEHNVRPAQGPRPKKKAPPKKRRPPAGSEEVDMPAMMRIG
jgi:uncharacterized membrane protein